MRRRLCTGGCTFCFERRDQFLAVPRAESKGMGAMDRRRGAVATLLAGLCWFFQRRDHVRSLHEEE